MKKTILAASTALLGVVGLGGAAHAQAVRVQAPFVDVGVGVPGVYGNQVDVRALRGGQLAGVRVGNVADVRVGAPRYYNDQRRAGYNDRVVRRYEPAQRYSGGGVRGQAAYNNGYQDGYADGRSDGEAIAYSQRGYPAQRYGYRNVPAQYGAPGYGYYNGQNNDIATYVGVATQLLNAFAQPQY